MATTYVDIPATAVHINNEGGVSGSVDVTDLGDINSPSDHEIFGGGFTTPTTTFFISQWGSQPPGEFNLPTAPTGFPNLEGAFYVLVAYRNSAESHDGFPTPSFGLNPDPEDSPFLQAAAGSPVLIDHIPKDSMGVVVGRASQDLSDLAVGTYADQWSVGTWDGSGFNDATIHLGYIGIRLVYNDGATDLPCDTWVDLDLSTAVFVDSGSGILGQYVDGVITGLDGQDPHYSFPLTLDPLKGDLVEVTFDPTSPWDGTGDPMISDRFILLRDYLPGDEVTPGDDVQIGDGFDNLADVCTLKIGPGIGNWNDVDFGVTQGYTGLRFQTSFSGAVSAIRVRKLCTVGAPPLRQYPRNDGLGASTTRRVWPVPNTIQASNRRGPSAIL